MVREEELIERLGLRPHPEGGFYAEVFRSERKVLATESRVRAALTAIYFLLWAGDVSRWHRVRSDEVWTFVEGDPLDVHVIDPRPGQLRSTGLGLLSNGCAPHVIVPADCWQAAEPRGAYSLVNCFVAPGFDFQDFAMAAGADREKLTGIAPELSRLI